MVTKHRNEVILDSELIRSAQYVSGTAVATKGQPIDPQPEIKVHEGSVAIVMASGRKKSEPIAKRFVDLSGGRGHMFAPLGGQEGAPKELNFMFGLSLEFKDGTRATVYLGQGSTKTMRNNWWIGSPDLEVANPARLLQYTVSGTDLKTDLGDMIDSVNIPPKYKIIADFLQVPIKHMTQKVNVFKIT